VRARNPGIGAIEEDPQAQSFCALHGHKAHLPANMVDVVQQVQLRFVASGVNLQLRDALLNRLPEPQTHLEAFLSSALSGHEYNLEGEIAWASEICPRPHAFPVVADTNEAFLSAPDYGVA